MFNKLNTDEQISTLIYSRIFELNKGYEVQPIDYQHQ